ncbi:MAG TPA: hypothetical protein H9796_13375 [Candidatus Butyricimonas faecavium]|nr:hypothetical protein [Candidatus Butyricimonas faecavium]
MKNKLIYLISVLFVAVVCFSCSDNNDNISDKDLIGIWNYSGKAVDIHFKFEYNGDEISFPEGLIPSGVFPEGIPRVSEMGINIAMIKMALPMLANKYMSQYFQGIKFTSDTEMEILMTMNDQPITLKTTYMIQKDIIKVSTQSNGFKELLGTIPVNSIDLNYKIINNELTVYLNTSYVKTLLAVVPSILKVTDLTEEQQTMIEGFVKTFSINLKTLEFGAKLKK